MARSHSMKGSSGSSRHSVSGPSGKGQSSIGSSSIKNVGEGMGGSGNLLTRYSVTSPSGSTGLKGPAQPLKGVASKSPLKDNISSNGPRVYQVSKPSK